MSKQTPRFQNADALARDLRRAARRYLRQSGQSRHASCGQWCAATLWLAGLSGSLWALSGGGLWWALAAGVFAFLLLATLAHDAAHGSLSRNAAVNGAVVILAFAMFGISGRLWRWRHLKLHHNFANVAGTDIDGEGSLLLRLSPSGPWRLWHKAQPLYAPFLYALVFAHLAWVEDWAKLKQARLHAPQTFSGPWPLIEMGVWKAAHAGVCIIVPLLLGASLPKVLAGYVLYMGVASLLFVVVAAGTHLSEEAEFIAPDSGRIDHDWARHQLRTSVDRAPSHPLAVLLTGGSNAHTAHHLFPDFAHHHSAMLSRLVGRVAGRHGERHRVTSFLGMVRAHFQHLARMGRRPAAPLGAL